MTTPLRARAGSTLAALALLTAPLAAQAQTAQTKPAAAKPAAQPAAAATALQNVAQVCQMRGNEIVMVNNQLLVRIQAAQRENDQAKRAQVLAPTQQLRADLRELEASWQRMDCARLLYGRQ